MLKGLRDKLRALKSGTPFLDYTQTAREIHGTLEALQRAGHHKIEDGWVTVDLNRSRHPYLDGLDGILSWKVKPTSFGKYLSLKLDSQLLFEDWPLEEISVLSSGHETNEDEAVVSREFALM